MVLSGGHLKIREAFLSECLPKDAVVFSLRAMTNKKAIFILNEPPLA
jgi:hypothetical protein